MSGSIKIVTGFSASGKSTITKELMEQEPGWSLLLEDSRYVSPQTFFELSRQLLKREPMPSCLTTAVSSMVHEGLLKDALHLAQEGSKVIVDFASIPNTIDLLRKTYQEAHKQGVSVEIIWVTCSEATRQSRCKARGTQFDIQLSERRDYFEAVSKVERNMMEQAQDMLNGPMKIVNNDADNGSRQQPSHWYSLAEVKNWMGAVTSNAHANAIIRAANDSPKP